MEKISAYIPCFNAHATLPLAIQSLKNQTVQPNEILVIDDGSREKLTIEQIAESEGVRLIRHEHNLGRGAARARAMLEAENDLVVCCDSTKALAEDFVEKAMLWLSDAKVAAACGKFVQPPAASAAERWRGRHLFKIGIPLAFSRKALLSTAGAIVRKSTALSAGNYNENLRHTEDGELGQRLLDRGFDVIFDPELHVMATEHNSLWQVLERYWRWHAGTGEEIILRDYLRQIVFSIKVMAAQDLKCSDPLAAVISLLSPHYQLWKSLCAKRQNLTGVTSGREN
jgi:glycosyltransferase involved in cell wall biosynthesis